VSATYCASYAVRLWRSFQARSSSARAGYRMTGSLCRSCNACCARELLLSPRRSHRRRTLDTSTSSKSGAASGSPVPARHAVRSGFAAVSSRPSRTADASRTIKPARRGLRATRRRWSRSSGLVCVIAGARAARPAWVTQRHARVLLVGIRRATRPRAPREPSRCDGRHREHRGSESEFPCGQHVTMRGA